MYALAALLPLLPAKQREAAQNDWMSTDAEIACPDPNCGGRFRVTRLDKGTIGDPLNFVPEEQIDEVLFLPYCRQSAFADDAAKQGYRTPLKTCARLGMINGRGVTRVS